MNKGYDTVGDDDNDDDDDELHNHPVKCVFSTSGDAHYIGGYHQYIGGYHEYIGGFSTSRDIMMHVGGYHEYIRGIP